MWPSTSLSLIESHWYVFHDESYNLKFAELKTIWEIKVGVLILIGRLGLETS